MELAYERDHFNRVDNRRVIPLMADVASTYVVRSFASIIKRPNDLFRGMARHPELCCLVLAFLLTLIIKYGNSFKGKTVTLPAKQPKYMFSPVTLVLDSPRGSIVPLIQLLNQEEFVFVMYYAPWCSKSQSARTEFIKAANYFKGNVKFAAVNCWWPEGECRKRYKFLLFPVFMAYHTKLDGYRYFGVPRAERMISFVENLLAPLTVVHSRMEVIEMVAEHDTVVLGYFNLSTLDNIGAYKQFYFASMRILEKDPLQPTKFLVVTHNDVAQEFNLTKFEDIAMLRLTNSSLVYPFVNNVTSSSLVNWVLENKDLKTVKRLSPEGIKSQALATEINKGPAFIMFHVENPLFDIDHGFRVLKEIAFLYRQCMIQPAFRGIRDVWSERWNHQIRRYKLLVQMCDQSRITSQETKLTPPCCISTLVHGVNASIKVCSVCRYKSSVCSVLPEQLSFALHKSRPLPLCCHNVILNYSWSDKLSICCHLRNEHVDNGIEWVESAVTEKWNSNSEDKEKLKVENKTSHASQTRRPTDRYVRHHLENLPRRLCDRLSVEKQQGIRSPDYEPDTYSVDFKLQEQQFTEVGCKSNKSLNFYAIDSQNHWMFYDALGMKPFITLGKPMAVLFDKMNEEHYILKESFTLSSTMSFILDFEQGKLKRHKQTHSFQPTICDEKGQVCVNELISETFLDAVMEEDKDAVVLIYAHWCGFCQTLSHIFLAVAQYFSSSRHITFARINGAINDLPWEFTTDSYPSILFFPVRRKSDSVLFPVNEEITFLSLVNFVLQHATLETRLYLAADVCSRNCITENIKQSTSLLQTLQLKLKHLQTKLPELSPSASVSEANIVGSPSGEYYEKLNVAFLNSQLKRTQAKIEQVTKLIDYLKAHEDTVISKQELANLFSQENFSSA